MPWAPADAKEHTSKADRPELQRMWAEVANRTLKAELAKGRSQEQAEARAVRVANAAVKGARKKRTTEQREEEMPTDQTEPLQEQRLQEFADSRGLQLNVDPEQGWIRGVKILGLTSQNSRSYLKEAVARAVPLYESAKVNVNHPPGSPEVARGYEARLGHIENVRLEQQQEGLFADLRFNPKHALAEQLLWDAEHAPQNVGFSHNADGKVRRHKGQPIVEEITRVHSVDLVADPATTRGLFEQLNSPEEEELDMDELTLEQLKTDRPDLVEAIGAAAVAGQTDATEVERLTAQNTARTAEVKSLVEQNEKLQAANTAHEKADKVREKKEKITALLKEAKLPDDVVDASFLEQLHALEIEGAKHLLETVQKAIKKAGSTGPQSKEQNRAEGAAADIRDSKTFAEQIT